MVDRWFPYRNIRSNCSLRLICLPYAGGGAAIYRSLEQYLAPSIELCAAQLPGREGRFSEPLCFSMISLLDMLEPQVARLLDRSFALLGYSAGAIMAHALALRMADRVGRSPVHLFVAACAAPRSATEPFLHSAMADTEFRTRVLELNQYSQDLTGNPELLSLTIPAMRADLNVIETFDPPREPRLSCPVSAFSGDNDPQSPPASLRGWAEVTTGDFEAATLPGGHFFIRDNARHLARRISQTLVPD